MSAEGQALRELAESVADGQSVDWASIETRTFGREKRLVRHLRLVENISALYRSLPADEDEGDEALATEPAPEGSRWGRLVLRDGIGQGTSAEVFRAFDTELHREVALKLLRDDESSSPGAHARILQEARRLARVRHPHVVQVYGAEQHDGRVGLWMELVRGESLEQIVRTRGPFSAREAAHIGQDVCAALAAVHGAALLHRDVKAQNVLRESGGRIVLMDFGTGEELRRQIGSARMVGTPLYLAPEIFKGQAASAQTDIYSLGVLLFYLVTGEFPVVATTMERLAWAHGNGQLRRLRDVRPDLPASFVRPVERALEREPSARFASAGEMEAALREAADGFRPTAPAVTEFRPTSSRRRLAFAALAATLVVVLGLIAWGRWGGRGLTRSDVSIAVLPIIELAGSEAPAQFADGLTDQLIATLGEVTALRVTSRASVVPFRNHTGGVADVIDQLDVDAVVQTTMTARNGNPGGPNHLRLEARIIKAGDEVASWSQTFEGLAGKSRELQAAMAREIALAMGVSVSPGVTERLARQRQTSPAAEEAYLQGRIGLSDYGGEAAQRALAAFQRATQFDATYAPAHAGMARAYINLGANGVMPNQEARVSALAAVQRALSEAPDLPEGHAALAAIKFLYDWDWVEAEREFQRTLELNPSFSWARNFYAQFLASRGRGKEALEQSNLFRQLDPRSTEPSRTLGIVLYYQRDFRTAESVIRDVLNEDPTLPGMHGMLGRVLEAQNRIDEAVDAGQRAVQLAGRAVVPRVQLVRLYFLAGRRAEAHALWSALQKEAGERTLRLYHRDVAYVRLAMGDEDTAIDAFELALDERDQSLVWLGVDARVDPIRQHPRFRAVLEKIGF